MPFPTDVPGNDTGREGRIGLRPPTAALNLLTNRRGATASGNLNPRILQTASEAGRMPTALAALNGVGECRKIVRR